MRTVPTAIAATLAILGALVVGRALSSTVKRRRGELGVLGCLGFVPRQRRTVIAAQATSIGAAALVIGIPLGLVVGRLAWSTITGSMGIATDASHPFLQIAVGAVLFVLALNLIATIPAWRAGRPAEPGPNAAGRVAPPR